jgi:hypothetical protein
MFGITKELATAPTSPTPKKVSMDVQNGWHLHQAVARVVTTRHVAACLAS